MMASSRASSEDPSKIELLKDALYQAVVDNGSESRLWGQSELLDLDVIPERNLVLLMKAVQGLCSDFLFRSMNDSRFGLCWKYRLPEDAMKYKQLNQDQIMVYELIDDAGADGIWARNLKTRLNMHDSVMKQCIKFLEAKGFIRDMKSVENIGKKMYIKATLRPSERATGGPWYTDATLDEAFIGSLQKVIFEFIRNKSAYLSRRSIHASAAGAAVSGGATKQPKKGTVRGGAAAGAEAGTAPDADGSGQRGRKRGAEALSTGDDEHAGANGANGANGLARRGRRYHEVFVPKPAGFTEYPTVRQLAELIEQSGVTNNTTLGESDVQQIVDVLVYDGLLEPVRQPHTHETGYRALNVARLPTDSLLQGGDDESIPVGAPALDNGLTESPCGTCPVFELCEDGGPVSPANCVYFNTWLGLEGPSTPPLAQGIGASEQAV